MPAWVEEQPSHQSMGCRHYQDQKHLLDLPRFAVLFARLSSVPAPRATAAIIFLNTETCPGGERAESALLARRCLHMKTRQVSQHPTDATAYLFCGRSCYCMAGGTVWPPRCAGLWLSRELGRGRCHTQTDPWPGPGCPQGEPTVAGGMDSSMQVAPSFPKGKLSLPSGINSRFVT